MIINKSRIFASDKTIPKNIKTKMKVIVVKNQPDRGKTKTLNLLLSFFSSVIKQKPTQLGGDKQDFHIDFSYKGKEIGIISVGDTNGGRPLLQEPILKGWYMSKKYDIIVCTCHTAKTTYDLIETIFAANEIIWFSNYTSSDTLVHDCLNQNSAQSIFNLIEDIITKRIV